LKNDFSILENKCRSSGAQFGEEKEDNHRLDRDDYLYKKDWLEP